MRVGVIGVGSMGQNHARVYSEVAELVGVCDKDAQIGKAIARRFGTSYYPSSSDLLSRDLDAVSVTTPTSLHFDIAREAIEAGVPVLVEKPFTGDVGQARELTRLAREQGVLLAAGLIERHNPVVEFAYKALQEDAYGKVITVSSRRVSSFPTRVRDLGVLMDLGTHDVDVMRYLVGTDVVQVYSVAGRERHDVFEDRAIVLLTFESGVSGVVEVNWLTPMKVRKLALTCSKNFVELDYIEQALEISSSTLKAYDASDLFRAPFEYDVRRVALEKQEPLKREIEDFLRTVEEGGKPLVDGEEATETLKVVTAAIESHKRGVPVEVA